MDAGVAALVGAFGGAGTDVVKAVEAANDYAVELGKERSEDLVARWPSIHADLLDASNLLDLERPK